MSDERKIPEAVRNAVSIVRGVLDPLDKETRHAVFEELNLILAKELTRQDREVEELRLKVAEWQRHNEQRLEEVYAARELLKATPNETLPAAVKRMFAIYCETGWAEFRS